MVQTVDAKTAMQATAPDQQPVEAQPASPELAAALAALQEAQAELVLQNGSAGAQVGRHIVEMARHAHNPLRFVRQLPSFALSTWELMSLTRIDTSLFVSLPAQSRPNIDLAGRKEARLAAQLARLTANFQPGEAAEASLARIAEQAQAPWLKARAVNALELARHARHGFPLPSAAPRSDNTGQRVAYIVRHDPLSITNGYTRRTHEIVTGLTRQGWSVDCIVAPQPGPAAVTVSYDGALYHRLITSAGYKDGLAGYVNQFADAIVARAAVHKPVLIHAASNFINGLAGAAAARRLGLPFIYEVRGLWELTRLTVRADAETTLGFHAQSCLEAQAAKAADRVLVLSDELGTELERRGLPAGRTRLAMSGSPVMQPATPEIRAEARRSFNLAPDAFTVGYIGSLVAYEGLEILVRAVAAASATDSRIRLLVIGDGYERAALESLAQRLGASDRVTFTGRVASHLAKQAYAAIDLAVYPRRRLRVTEVVPPLKHLEAAAAGVPIIVSDVAPLRTFAERTNAAVCVPADNSEALARAILDLSGSPAKLRQLGESGLTAARALTWQTTASTIAATYKELAG